MPSTAQQMADPKHWGSNLPQWDSGDFDTWQAYQKALRGAYQDYRQSPGGERLPGVAVQGTWRQGNAPSAGSAAADAFQQAYERANQEGVTSAANGLAMRSRAGVRPDEAQMAYDAWKLDPTTGEASPLLKSNVLAALEQMGFRPPVAPGGGGPGGGPAGDFEGAGKPVPTMPGPGQPQHPTMDQLNPVAWANANGPNTPTPGAGESPLGSGYESLVNFDMSQFIDPVTGKPKAGLTPIAQQIDVPQFMPMQQLEQAPFNDLMQQMPQGTVPLYQQMQQQGGQVPGAPMPPMDQINLHQFDPYSMGQLPPAQAQQLIQDPKNYNPNVFAAIQRLQGGQRRPVY